MLPLSLILQSTTIRILLLGPADGEDTLKTRHAGSLYFGAPAIVLSNSTYGTHLHKFTMGGPYRVNHSSGAVKQAIFAAISALQPLAIVCSLARDFKIRRTIPALLLTGRALTTY